MSSLKFSIANNAVTHLGRNLYSTTPPALAELVANSYDAYATIVDITLSDDSISIVDNGKGLSLKELESKYAIIGYAKKYEEPINDLDERKPMGKKGIGKLAAFSLGNEYTVYSKCQGSDSWISFNLKYREMISKEDYEVEISEGFLPPEFSKYESYSSGFIVKITDTRRKTTVATRKNIRNQLSRRFYINQSKTDFKLNIDGEELKLDSNEYYDKIEYLFYFGNENRENLESKFTSLKHIEEYNDKEEIKSFFIDSDICGWIGTTRKPKDLKDEENSSFANIIILANGKIADEDILKGKSNARIANNYIVGEVRADAFISTLDDPITSSRQGLDDSIPAVEELIDMLNKIRDYVIERWGELRRDNIVESLPERIKTNASYQGWLSNLSNKQKKINNRLLELLSARIDEENDEDQQAVDSMLTSIASVINNIESDDLIFTLYNDQDEKIQFELLLKLMENIAKTEDINHASLIKKRLSAINKLEELMSDTNTPEKLFEKHLSDNPWLIKPYWNIDRNNPTQTDYLRNQEYFRLDNGNENFKRNFLDISIRVAEEKYPIIIELKKNSAVGYAKVSYLDIYSQVTNYRRAMIQKIPELHEVDEKDIPVIFILSEDTGLPGSGNSIELSKDEIGMLAGMNISILKYNKIIAEAKKMYREHIQYQKDIKLIPDLTCHELEGR